MSYSDSVVLEIFKLPHPIFAIISLWRGLGPLFEQFRIPFTQGWFIPSLIEIGLLVLQIDYLLFYVLLKNISLIWRGHHYRWRSAKFRPMLSLWAGRDLYCATPTVTQDFGFSGLIRTTAPFSCLLRHTRGCGGSILTQMLWRFFKNFSVFLFFCYHLPLGMGVPLHLNKLESPPLRMICAKSGLNWPSGSGEEVENVKVHRQTVRRTDRQTTGDQNSSLELSCSSGELKNHNPIYFILVIHFYCSINCTYVQGTVIR
jgi:hypothetical protein